MMRENEGSALILPLHFAYLKLARRYFVKQDSTTQVCYDYTHLEA